MFGELARAWISVSANYTPLKEDFIQIRGFVSNQVNSISGLGRSILIGAGLGALAAGVGGVMSAMIGGNAQMEQYQLTLEVLLKSSEKASKLLKEIEEMASTTPMTTSNLTGHTQQAIAMGFALEEVLPLLRTVGDAAAASPLGVEAGMHRIIRALGQMKAKGRAQGDEFLQLMEAGIPAARYVAEALGKTQAEVFEMMRSGSLDAATAIKAILEGMNRNFGGVMEKQSRGWIGLTSTLKDLAEIILREVGEPLFALAKVKLTNLVDWLQKGGGFEKMKEYGRAAMEFGKRLFDIVRSLAPMAAGLWAANKAASMLISTLIGGTKTIMAFVKAGSALGIIGGPIGALVIALGLLAGAFIAAKLEGESFGDWLNLFKDRILGVTGAVTKLRAEMQFEKDFSASREAVDNALKNEHTGDGPASETTMKNIIVVQQQEKAAKRRLEQLEREDAVLAAEDARLKALEDNHGYDLSEEREAVRQKRRAVHAMMEREHRLVRDAVEGETGLWSAHNRQKEEERVKSQFENMNNARDAMSPDLENHEKRKETLRAGAQAAEDKANEYDAQARELEANGRIAEAKANRRIAKNLRDEANSFREQAAMQASLEEGDPELEHRIENQTKATPWNAGLPDKPEEVKEQRQHQFHGIAEFSRSIQESLRDPEEKKKKALMERQARHLQHIDEEGVKIKNVEDMQQQASFA